MGANHATRQGARPRSGRSKPRRSCASGALSRATASGRRHDLQTGAVPLDVNPLRRRPPGPRVLVYLDQSTLSALVTEERFADVRDQLRSAMYDDRLVCPTSLEHTGETIPARDSWEDITKLADELSMGVDFRPEQELRAYEVRTAAELFFEGQSKREVWQEAFKTDPHAPREKLFPGGFRVHAYHRARGGRLRRSLRVDTGTGENSPAEPGDLRRTLRRYVRRLRTRADELGMTVPQEEGPGLTPWGVRASTG